MPRPRTVYRGKRKYSWIITLAAMLVVIAIALAVWLFYYLQRFIVYDKDGLRLDLSAQREEILHPGAAEPTAPPAVQHVDVEIVVDQRDYSDIRTGAGRNLRPIHGVFVPAKDVTENTLKYYSENMGDFDALVLELKGADGFLRWHSGVAQADSFALNGTLELAELLAPLKEQGVYLIAQISALADSAMAQRNAPIALKNAVTGQPFSAADGTSYLDPYNDSTRAYLLALLTELQGMGFDEVMLSGVSCPDSDAVRFSMQMTKTPDSVTAVSSFALWLREQADPLGLRLSALIGSDALHSDGGAAGQNPVLFFKAFDRVAVATDFDGFAADVAALETALGTRSSTRIVAVTEDYTPELESYIIRGAGAASPAHHLSELRIPPPKTQGAAEAADIVDSPNSIERKEGISVPSLQSPHARISLAAWVCLLRSNRLLNCVFSCAITVYGWFPIAMGRAGGRR